jgi:AcrR family transcriptional regulator
MARWTPDTRGRLRRSALELFADRGFQDVTAGEIAERAGLTERTFYRHFPTKEEVLFTEGDTILAGLVDAIETSAPDASPRQLIVAVAERLGEIFQPDRVAHRQRSAVIGSEPALRERDLLKQEQWASALVASMVKRGVDAGQAALLASTMAAVFRVVYARWVTDRSRAPLATQLTNALDATAAGLNS